MYVLKFTEFELADVRRLPKNTRNALKKELLNKIATDPEGHSEGLQGALRGYRSFHWRDYRGVFRVFPGLQAVAVVGIGKHAAKADIYRRLEVLVSSGQLADKVLVSLRGFSRG